MSENQAVALFTSIMPRKLDEQLAALATWRGFASRIVTVNERREAALLTDLPDWIEQYSFYDTPPYDRFYVRLSKLAQAMGSVTDYRRVAFCNSDISLAKRYELERILQMDNSDLIFSSRTDTDDEGTPLSVYTDGWDFFAFRPQHARMLDNRDLYIGLPWWDFFVPLSFLKQGLRANRLDGSHVHHIKHDQAWDKTEFYKKGNIVLNQIVGVQRRLNEEQVHRFAHHVNTFLNSHALEGHGPSQEAAMPRLVELWREMHAPMRSWNVRSRELAEKGYGALAVRVHALLKNTPTVHRVVRSGHRRLSGLARSKLPSETKTYRDILSAPRDYYFKTTSDELVSCSIGVPLPIPNRPSTFVFGIFKGGSTLLNVMLDQILAETGRTSVDLPNYLRKEGLVIDEIAEDLDGLFKLSGVVFDGFSTYSKVLKNSTNFGNANKILMVRDPRDILVSLYFSYAEKHSLAESGIDDYALENAKSVRTHLLNLGALMSGKTTLVRYEDVIFDKLALAKTICAVTGIEVAPVKLAEIAKSIDIRSVKEAKHRHVRPDTPGDHKNKLKPETIARLDEFMKPVFEIYFPEAIA